MGEKRLTPSDAVFLYGETRETMMHVASMLIFSPPNGVRPDFLRKIVEEIKETHDVYPPWNLKLKTPEFLANPFHSWVEDPNVDLDYHIRRSALPAPGDERELGILVSRLHSHEMDFHHPLWEVHLIEGLEGGRFALYIKIHHSLVDGFTGSKILARSLSTSPNDLEKPMFFALPPPEARSITDADGDLTFRSVLKAMKTQYDSAKQVGREMLDSYLGHETGVVMPSDTPNCILNGRISRNRRFATQQYALERLKVLAKKGGCTLNDIVMALSSGSLRRFLLDLGELPDKPLIAMVPVNVRPKDDPGGGNAVGSMLVSLATDVADPEARLKVIVESARHAKAQLRKLTREGIIQYSALLLLPAGLQAVAGLSGRMRPPYNVVISNVPGPETPLYFRGARLEAVYPLSIPIHGQACNITCTSYAGTINFGFTGCRDTLPHMQRLAVYMGEALLELEEAIGT